MARAALLMALAACACGGCYTIAAAGIQDCKERGCYWNYDKARCECSAIRGSSLSNGRVPGKLEGQ